MSKAIRCILLPMLLLLLQQSYAQSNTEVIQESVKLYNELHDYTKKLKPEELTQAQVDSVFLQSNAVVKKLQGVFNSGTASFEEIKAAYYFTTNSFYELMFIYGMKGQNALAFTIGEKITSDVDSFNASFFPLNYVYFGKSYSVNYENYAHTRVEFYTGMAEISYNLSKYELSAKYSKKAINSPDITTWFKYIAVDKLIGVKKQMNQYDTELMDYNLLFLETYNKLDTSYYSAIKKNKLSNYITVYNTLKYSVKSNSELNLLYYKSKAGLLFLLPQINNSQYGFEFLDDAINGGYGLNDNEFLKKVAEKSVQFNKKSTGLIALKNLYDNYTVKNDYHTCSDLNFIVEQYTKFGETELAKKVHKSEEKCLEEAAKRAKAEEKRRKRRNASRYAAVQIYPLSLLPAKGYRDFGGNLFLFKRKVGHEFSYRMVNQNKEIPTDLYFKDKLDDNENRYLWNGFNAAYGIYSKVGNNSSRGNLAFIGAYFEYSKKTFETRYSGVVDNNSVYLGTTSYNATANRYTAYLNYGLFGYGRKFGPVMQFWMSYGVSYNTWNSNSSYESNRSLYTFDDSYLMYRKKSYFAPAFRFGLSVGLGFGKD